MAIPGYRILRKIRQGGMSTVYLAIQQSVGREVAIKVMSPNLGNDPSFGSRFYREAKIVGQLSHPNIVSIYDVGSYKHYNYIAMDYLPGAPLLDRLEHGIDTFDSVKVIREMAAALEYAHHRGYVHRDIKPDNILFRDDGSAVLCDFGIAKALKGNIKMTNYGAVLGTPHYMSPEQAQGKQLDGRADIYSLGVVFFQMLTGQLPFNGDDAIAIAIKHMTSPIPKLYGEHKAYQTILEKMLAKKADDRYQTGNEIIEALDQLQQNAHHLHGSNHTNTNSTSAQVINLLSALFTTLSSTVQLSFKRLLLSTLKRPRHSVQLSHQQLEDLDKFILSETDDDLPEALSDIPLIQDTIEQPALDYHWRKLLWPVAIVVALGIAGIYFSELISPKPANESLDEALASSKQAHDNLNATIPNPLQHNDETDTTSVISTAATNDIEATPVVKEVTVVVKPAPPKPKPTFTLTINTEPNDATVKVLNIKPRYQPGMILTEGSYHIAVTAVDYFPANFWIKLNKNHQRFIKLEPTRRALPSGSLTHDLLADGSKGPLMVILPKNSITTDANGKALSIPFAAAIGQHEVTFQQYDAFAIKTGRYLPRDFNWGRGNRPVVDVSYEDASAYASWLSEQTQQRYRLPTQQEWEFAYRAGQTSPFWWGVNKTANNANCRRGCNSQYSKLFSSSTAPVSVYPANGYGLYDTAGNVAEWVNACQQWQDKTQNNCLKTLVAGGSHTDSIANIAAYSSEAKNTSDKTNNIGFRLLLEL